MQQYFVSGMIRLQEPVLLNDQQRHHIQTVLRMKEHQQIRMVDESQRAFLCELHQQGNDLCAIPICMLESVIHRVSITLALALIKGERWDYALQKCSELGVDSIQPLITSRCVVKLKEADQSKKLQRWNRITMEACEQCHRSDLVTVHKPCTIAQMVSMNAEAKLLAYENADAQSESIVSFINDHPHIQSIVIAIGPEGGFTKDEVMQFHELDFRSISLGRRILRAETAAMSAVNILSLLYEN